MTSNQIAAESNRIKDREEQERRRSNRSNEAISRDKVSQERREQDRRDKAYKRENVYKGLDIAEKVIGATPYGMMKKIQNSFAKNMAGILGSANDPSWYALNKQMLEDAASISFENPLQNGLILGSAYNKDQLPQASSFIPRPEINRASVVNLTWITTIGKGSLTSTTPINLAAQNIYAWVRHANSGHSNYEPADLMLYILAVSEAYKLYAWGRNIYRIANSMFAYDLNLIKAIETCTGVDISDFRANLANMRYFLNVCATRLNALNVPSEFPFFDRHVWLASNIFKDSPIAKSAYYIFRPASVGLYTEGSSAEATGSLVMTAITDQNFNSFQSVMNNVINRLMASEDIGIISGDIKKAYGDKLFKIESTPTEDYINPVYSEEVLAQINNITFACDASVSGPSYAHQLVTDEDIHQAPGSHFLYQGHYASTLTEEDINVKYHISPDAIGTGYVIPPRTRSALINMYMDRPTPNDVMVGSRLAQTYQSFDGNGLGIGYRTPDSVGSEVILNAFVAYASIDTSVGTDAWTWKYVAIGDNANHFNNYSTGSGYTYSLPALTAQIDWFPSYSINSTSSTQFTNNYFIVQDLDNFALVPSKSLENMHSCALLSMFHIPQDGLK